MFHKSIDFHGNRFVLKMGKSSRTTLLQYLIHWMGVIYCTMCSALNNMVNSSMNSTNMHIQYTLYIIHVCTLKNKMIYSKQSKPIPFMISVCVHEINFQFLECSSDENLVFKRSEFDAKYCMSSIWRSWTVQIS